ncbi:hypothetical protein E0Z10_g2183 [Xylaria hypoxylon]|uniref:Zn(2)-C6 fungal-type domain-containing protein n=1 Tax=Xylaria hypoxylon TaxID=37992 RepID=A0A4Z0YRL8_9PEZI|nr:hypothetical protein E0Z10_g2183 [Xylaria hypoxylon]
MSEAELNIPLERRPACDNCKTRKTKCDRRSPCASCITLSVPCRTTHRAGEKRQRVLLSTKYEDAVQDVSRQLADVREMLQTLMSKKDTESLASGSQEASLDAPAYTPQSMIDEQVPVLDSVQEGYDGDTSFTSHAHQIKTALEATLLPSELELPSSEPVESQNDQGNDKSTATTKTRLLEPNDLGLRNMPLPPNEIVLKLLRLAKTEEQRFFVDLPLYNIDEFITMCRDIYFATEPISIWKWIGVNVGLYSLFMSISKVNCQRLGTTVDIMHEYTKIPRSNAETALQSLRLCSEPSIESCRALAVLANFYVKHGHSTIAWRLISGAARAALDLGLHRLTSSDIKRRSNNRREFELFWHIYTWEKGLAMTCGKSPTIRHSDVSSDLHKLTSPLNRAGLLNKLYGAYVDVAIVMGDIEESLFSVVAQNSSQQTRLQHVKRLASRLAEILNNVKAECPDDPSWGTVVATNLGGIITTLHIILHCQLAIVYRFLPPTFLDAHPLQCSTECVNEARVALSMLVETGEEAVAANVQQWGTLLNTILAMVPLVPFIVLAGNAIATSSGDDLPLLSKMASLLAPVAVNSPLARKVHGACESLHSIADRVVSSASPLNLNIAHQQYPDDQEQFDYAFPMGQQDWDSVMTGFESSEFGNYDSRTLTNIIEPCFANTYW